jgi:hypothetical protein
VAHTPVRDGSAKGKIERQFRTLKSRWLDAIKFDEFKSIGEANEALSAFIRKQNSTENSSIKCAPIERYQLDGDKAVRSPDSQEWLDHAFMNIESRKVRRDSTLTLDGQIYEVDSRLIGKKVTIHYLPNQMESAYIVYQKVRYSLSVLDKVANSKRSRLKADNNQTSSSKTKSNDDYPYYIVNKRKSKKKKEEEVEETSDQKIQMSLLDNIDYGNLISDDKESL